VVTGPAGAGIMAGVDAGPLTPADGRGEPGPSARPDAWERWVVGWHLGFWLLLALAALWAVSSAHLDPAERGSALAVVAVLGLAYGLLIQRGDSRGTARARLYLVVAVVVTGVGCAISPNLTLLLFVLFPQMWMFSEDVREGAAFTVALAVATMLGFAADSGWSTRTLREDGPQMVASLLFSLLLGFWISRIIDQSRERAELIDQLEAARTELAAADHARGVMAERERVAREIHDTLAQGFTSIVMLAQLAAVERDGTAAAGRLRDIEDVARENLAEARALVAAFTPVGLEDATLRDAVHRLAERFTRETGVLVDVRDADLDGAALDREHEVVVLRAVQEALANVRRHARARHVTVGLSVDGTAARLEVADDGVGFAPGGVDGGFGLAGMRSRVAEVGGEVEVASTPGAGTLVTVRLPGGRG